MDQGNGDLWTPANYDDDYAGRMTMRRALMRSSNTVTVRISRSVGEANVVSTARANGIASPLRAVPSLALGAMEVTPLVRAMVGGRTHVRGAFNRAVRSRRQPGSA